MEPKQSTDAERKEFIRLWFEFLKRNEDYAECCDLEGEGPHGWLYEQIGDVHNCTFEAWWKANQSKFDLLDFTVHRAFHISDFHDYAHADDAMLVVVNLYAPKKDIKAAFSKLLEEHHPNRGPGRPRLGQRDDVQPTIMKLRNSGRDPKLTNRIKHLQKVLEAYQLRVRNPELPLYEIARILKINPKRNGLDDQKTRRLLSTAAARLVRHADEIIDNVLLGEFPVYSR